MERAPHDVAPGRAVPEPAEDHGRKQVEQGAALPATRPPEGVVDEVSQPPAEGHVPAPPIVSDAGGRIRVVEVVGNLEAEQQCAAAHQVHVAGKVAVDLHRVPEHRHPQRRRGVVLRHLEDIADTEIEQERSEHHPLEQTGQDERDGERQLLDAGRRRPLDLRQQVASPADRTDQQLGKERHEHREVDQALRLRTRLAVHFDQVGDGLERVERDADRQDDLRDRQVGAEPHGEERIVQGLGEEAGVLEPRQRNEVGRHPEGKPPAPRKPRPPVDDTGDHVVAGDGERQQPHEIPPVAAVDPGARGDQQQLLRRARPLECPEGGQRHEQEQEELGRFKGHRTAKR